LALKSNPSFLFRLASQGVAYLLFLTVLTWAQSHWDLVVQDETAASIQVTWNQGAAKSFERNTTVPMS
jgi:hypothetical protein